MSNPERSPTSASARLKVFALLSWLCYIAVVLSTRSLHESGSGEHSLLWLLALFAAAFGCYFAALRLMWQGRLDGRALPVIWTGAVIFRLTLLISNPIEEIDLYRYVWDGAVSTAGVSPFRYTPQQVLAASAIDPLPADLARLVAVRDQSPELTAILKRVHFGELPTIYPPVSQVVFALSSWATPSGSSIYVRLLLMKAWFAAFDLATIGVVIRLLRQTQRPATDVLAYAWCPLVVKEIANSGHLDSLAVFLTTLSLSWALSAVGPSRRGRGYFFAIASAAALALGIGAKLYPLVLVPLLLATWARLVGWRVAVSAAFVLVAMTAGVLWPMRPAQTRVVSSFSENSVAPTSTEFPPVPPPEVSTDPQNPAESLQAFLSRWEMNDFLFLLVIENLRPTSDLPPEQVAWFAVTPESWRAWLVDRLAGRTALVPKLIPFAVTRLLLSVVFAIIAVALAWWAGSTDSSNTPSSIQLAGWPVADRVLPAAFLTLTWFWLLLPTQNPWYLVWSLPFVSFITGRSWYLLSGLAFTYYVRFWLAAQFPTPLCGTPYPGPQFFDFIITWLEFGPWLTWLLTGWMFSRYSLSTTTPVAGSGSLELRGVDHHD